jgi:rRNA maturation endonuclease Nob1
VRPFYVECQECEATYQLKHDMSEVHYNMSFCSFCGGRLEDFYDPNQREMFSDEDGEEVEW